MKTIAVFAVGLIIAGCPAGAQELTKQAKIERILTLTKADAMMDQAFNQMKGMIGSQIPRGTPEQQVKAQEIEQKVMDLIKERMGGERMRREFVKIYDELFSDEEIDGILAFYQSPAGRATLERMPQLMSKAMAFAQAQMADLLPEIQRITREAAQK